MDSKLTVWYFGLVGCGTVKLVCRYQRLVRTCCLHLQVGTKAQQGTNRQAACYFHTVSEIRFKALFQSTVVIFAAIWDWTNLFDWRVVCHGSDALTLPPWTLPWHTHNHCVWQATYISSLHCITLRLLKGHCCMDINRLSHCQIVYHTTVNHSADSQHARRRS
jgi:hypothetical protein